MARSDPHRTRWLTALLLDAPPGHIRLPAGRVCVRDWTLDDFPTYRRLELDPRIQAWQLAEPKTPTEIRRAFRAALGAPLIRPRADFDLAVAIDDAGRERAVGFVHLWMRPIPRPTATLGYSLLPEWWGRGLMTDAVGAVVRAALGEWGFARIEAGAFGDNRRSRAILEGLGFELERVRRRAYRKGGALKDDCRYALDRPSLFDRGA